MEGEMMKMKSLFAVFAAAMISGCVGGLSNIKPGGGSSPVSGSAGKTGAQGAQANMTTCAKVIGTAALSDNGYSAYNAQVLVAQGLPSDPTPLLRLAVTQSGCFKIVDRGAGLHGVEREQRLARQGMVAEGQAKQARLVRADYTIVARLAFASDNTGGIGAAIGAFLPGPAGMVASGVSVRFSEAQVVLYVTDNQTGVQEAIAEGSAKANDIGIGGAFLGRVSVAGGGWSNTPEGKVVAAAFVDAFNKLIPQLRAARSSAKNTK